MCCRAWWTTTWWTVKEWVRPTTTGPFPARPCTLASTNWRSCKNRWGDWKRWPHISKDADADADATTTQILKITQSIFFLCYVKIHFHISTYRTKCTSILTYICDTYRSVSSYKHKCTVTAQLDQATDVLWLYLNVTTFCCSWPFL